MNYSNEINNKIKIIINSKKINLSDLSKSSGVSYRIIRSFINVNSNTTIKNICKIGNGLGIYFDYENVIKIIGLNIKSIRIKKSFTVSYLAKKTGVSSTSIKSYENGKSNMTINLISKIAKGLNISPFTIYSFSEFDTFNIKFEDIEITYTKPLFKKEYLNKEFSLSKSLLNGSCKKIKLINVIDGDTLYGIVEGKGYKIRLLVIDTPETIRNSQRWGIKAKKFVEYLIDKSSNVFVQLDTKEKMFDKWDRLLAWVWLEIDGQMKLLNSMLVQSGLATCRYISNHNSLYVPVLLEQERNAKINKRIIWGYKYLDPYWDYLLNKVKEPYYIISVEDKYIKVFDYELNKWELSDDATKFRNIEDCEYLTKRFEFTFKIIKKII